MARRMKNFVGAGLPRPELGNYIGQARGQSLRNAPNAGQARGQSLRRFPIPCISSSLYKGFAG
jgi:hypothetical protein